MGERAAASGSEILVPAGKTMQVEVSRLGYKTVVVPVNDKTLVRAIALEPLRVRVLLTIDQKAGTIELDGNIVGKLRDGAADAVEVPADGLSHSLAVVVGGKRTATLKFRTDPGERSQIEPIGNQEMLVVSSLGPAATIYGSAQTKECGV